MMIVHPSWCDSRSGASIALYPCRMLSLPPQWCSTSTCSCTHTLSRRLPASELTMQRSLTQAPGLPSALWVRHTLHIIAGKWSVAMDDLRTIISSSPSSPSASSSSSSPSYLLKSLVGLATLLKMDGETREAISVLSQVGLPQTVKSYMYMCTCTCSCTCACTCTCYLSCLFCTDAFHCMYHMYMYCSCALVKIQPAQLSCLSGSVGRASA